MLPRIVVMDYPGDVWELWPSVLVGGTIMCSMLQHVMCDITFCDYIHCRQVYFPHLLVTPSDVI